MVNYSPLPRAQRTLANYNAYSLLNNKQSSRVKAEGLGELEEEHIGVAQPPLTWTLGLLKNPPGPCDSERSEELALIRCHSTSFGAAYGFSE